MAGLTDLGIEIKTTQDLLDEMADSQRAGISPALNLQPASLMGNFNGVFADELAQAWEALRATYNASYPATASGDALTQTASITGTLRRGATFSRVVATLNLNAGVTITAGDAIAHVLGDATRRFVSIEDAVNAGGSPANVDVVMDAETAGAVECLAGQLTVIAEPISGWNSVTNADDANPVGEAVETDPELRVRRDAELASASSTADAIRADLIKANIGLSFCRVLDNDTDVLDDNGVPSKSIEVIAYGPPSPTSDDNTALAVQIRKSKPGGIRAYGSASEVVLDDQGNSFTIGYTRPTSQSVYLEIDITTDGNYPLDGDAQLKAAILAVGSYLIPGVSVVAERLKSGAWAVPGITDVPALRLGFSASPVGTVNLAIALREIASLDTGRILVTVL